MSECDKDLYASTCNPPRRVKRSAMTEHIARPFLQQSKTGAVSGQPRAILPMPTPGPTTQPGNDTAGQPAAKRARKSSTLVVSSDRPYTPRVNPTASPTIDPPPPAKRGRKPGPLSKTAREAQRRLNHSIIEKARRTKINDALATLKQLVPSDYLQAKQKASTAVEEDKEDDEDEDEDFETSNKKPKSKAKKEDKEFKLEILERTVTFLQDLLDKVNTMEATPATCIDCGTNSGASNKRKRAEFGEIASPGPAGASGEGNPKLHTTNSHRVSRSSSRQPNLESSGICDSPTIAAPRRPSALPGTQAVINERERLPPISSWLHSTSTAEIDPQLLPAPLVKKHRTSPSISSSYLPSPPSSTHFDPIRIGGAVPPILNLGPIATSSPMVLGVAPRSTTNKSPTLSQSSSNAAARTPEDESAASMLLHIASSPLFRPTSSSVPLPEPSSLLLHSDLDGRSQVQDLDYARQAQTPSSILGIRKS